MLTKLNFYSELQPLLDIYKNIFTEKQIEKRLRTDLYFCLHLKILKLDDLAPSMKGCTRTSALVDCLNNLYSKQAEIVRQTIQDLCKIFLNKNKVNFKGDIVNYKSRLYFSKVNWGNLCITLHQ